MRILLDLQICQIVSVVEQQEMLALVHGFVQQAEPAGHQVSVLLHLRLGENYDQLYLGLRSLLAREQIYSFDTPQHWPAEFVQQSALAIHQDYVRQLAPDMVYLPYFELNAASAATATNAAQPAFSYFQEQNQVPYVMHLCRDFVSNFHISSSITAESAPWFYQHFPRLQNARGFLVESSATHGALSQQFPALPVLQIEHAFLPRSLQIAQTCKPSMARRIVLLPSAQQLAIATQVLLFIAEQAEREAWVLRVIGANNEQWQALQGLRSSLSLPNSALELLGLEFLAQRIEHATPTSHNPNWLATDFLICSQIEHVAYARLACISQVPVLCSATLALASQLNNDAVFADENQIGACLSILLANPAQLARLLAQQKTLFGNVDSQANGKQLLNVLCSAAQPDLQARAPSAAPSAAPSFTPRVARSKARLAYISPLPPQQSGIADYSLELLPELARYFEIDLIVAQSELALGWVSTVCSVRDLAWFEQQAEQYEHILYHFGNSVFHSHMFDLLVRFPGVVVLHDFYLGNILYEMQKPPSEVPYLMHALYESHGVTALMEVEKNGLVAACWRYPSNKSLLQQAQGVIVHSHYPIQLAKQWYGAEFAKDWAVLPLLRTLPAALGKDHQQARREARATFGWQENDFVLCSFGVLGRTKRVLELLQIWLASSLGTDQHCHLVFVGEVVGDEYSDAMQQAVADCAVHGRVKITGYVSHNEYQQWLIAADAAVQLRINSRGETSAAVLDCLLVGLPTIINAHGSNAEIPDELSCKLPDQFSESELSDALERMWRDTSYRQQLSSAAKSYMATHHAPQQVGKLYQQALLGFAQRRAQYQQFLQQFTSAENVQHDRPAHALTISTPEWAALALALANNQAQPTEQQMFVDISALIQNDLRTGIQRVVRSILLALVAEPPAGFRVEPVYTVGHGHPYCYARSYLSKMYAGVNVTLDDSPICANHGDVFLGIDFFAHGTTQNQEAFREYRRRGVGVYFVVYDILPLLRPEVFPIGTEVYFTEWLDCIAGVADGLLCISAAVADDTHDWLQKRLPQRKDDLQLGFFHLGADLAASAPSMGLPDNVEQIMQAIAQRPSLLMVGTVEPRKGHAQSLAAVELLWQQGIEVNLIVVGKQGWMVDEVSKKMSQHAEHGKRLFWLAGISDEMLLKLYQSCSALLASSEGEGFGLPLIEAAQHEVPIIARNLPVFKEVLQEFAYYFEGLQPADLASALQAWLQLHANGQAPQSKDLPWLTWQQSATQLKKVIFEKNWYRQLAIAPVCPAQTENA